MVEHSTLLPPPELGGFDYLDLHNAGIAATPEEIALCGGRRVLTNAVTLPTSQSAIERDEVLTNPGPIEMVAVDVGGETVWLPAVYRRREKRDIHLNTSSAEPYVLIEQPDGTFLIAEFAEAVSIPGEDSRWLRGVRMKGHLGIHTGDMVSTIEVEVSPDNPTVVKSIQQMFRWGESKGGRTPKKMEIIAVGPPGMKNTTPWKHYSGPDDTRLGSFARPFPDISYFSVPSPEDLTPDVIASAEVIPGMLPDEEESPIRFHLGPNFGLRIGPNEVRADTHQAYREKVDKNNGLALHYRLAEYVYHLPTPDNRHGRMRFLGVTATRKNFDPDAPPKPPQSDIVSFDDITFGCLGRNGMAAVGHGDRYDSLGRVVRTFAPYTNPRIRRWQSPTK